MSTTQSAPWHHLSAAVLDYLLLSGLSTDDIRRMQEENIKRDDLVAERAECENDPETRPCYGADPEACQSRHDHQHDELNLPPLSPSEGAPRARAVSPPPWPWAHANQWLEGQRQAAVVQAE